MLHEAAGDVDGEAWAYAALAESRRKQGQFEAATARARYRGRGVLRLRRRRGPWAGLAPRRDARGAAGRPRPGTSSATRRASWFATPRRPRQDGRAVLATWPSSRSTAATCRARAGMAERALEIRTEANDRWGIGVSLGNLAPSRVKEGKLDEARDRSEEALRVFSHVGYPWMMANTENNLGNAARDLGDVEAARSAYASSLRRFASWDDRWALAILLEDVALLAASTGDHPRAITLVEAASALRDEIGASQGDALKDELRTRLAPSIAALTDADDEAARSAGRTLGLSGAVQLALYVCGEGPTRYQVQRPIWCVSAT